MSFSYLGGSNLGSSGCHAYLFTIRLLPLFLLNNYGIEFNGTDSLVKTHSKEGLRGLIMLKLFLLKLLNNYANTMVCVRVVE